MIEAVFNHIAFELPAVTPSDPAGHLQGCRHVRVAGAGRFAEQERKVRTEKRKIEMFLKEMESAPVE